MEVFYEDKPEPVKVRWEWGDTTDESDYDDDSIEEYEDDEVDELVVVDKPVSGRIYKVNMKGLDLCAKFVKTRPLIVFEEDGDRGVHEMAYHKMVLYVNEGDLVYASDEEVAQYLEESDCNNT